MIKINNNLYVLNKWSHVFDEINKYVDLNSTSTSILAKFKNPKLIYERLMHKVYFVSIDGCDFVFKIKADSETTGIDYFEKLKIVEYMHKKHIPTAEVIYLKDDILNEESHSLEFYVDQDLSHIKITQDLVKKLITSCKDMHNKGIVHGDLRLENILYKYNENNQEHNFYFIDFETFTKNNSNEARLFDMLRLYYSLKKHGYDFPKEWFTENLEEKINRKYYDLIENMAKKYV